MFYYSRETSSIQVFCNSFDCLPKHDCTNKDGPSSQKTIHGFLEMTKKLSTWMCNHKNTSNFDKVPKEMGPTNLKYSLFFRSKEKKAASMFDTRRFPRSHRFLRFSFSVSVSFSSTASGRPQSQSL
mmetsp:Transcript_6011/g.17104  ORF Transcript_6011/g.17104 Transcript_6011/m.17104 type:complete len:126 (-) Transcript_6011:1314-1691(-)